MLSPLTIRFSGILSLLPVLLRGMLGTTTTRFPDFNTWRCGTETSTGSRCDYGRQNGT